jgi:hypothetical protein
MNHYKFAAVLAISLLSLYTSVYGDCDRTDDRSNCDAMSAAEPHSTELRTINPRILRDTEPRECDCPCCDAIKQEYKIIRLAQLPTKYAGLPLWLPSR